MSCPGWRKKSFADLARCKTRNDRTKCGGFDEWMRRSALHGCLAMVGVGNVDHIIEKICEEARKIIPGKNLGAVISKEAKERIEKYITEAEKQGAKIFVDGRNAIVEGKENGTYVGPTVIDYVKPGMAVAREEIFGPVISIMRTETLDEALAIENASPYGNAASVFTQNGSYARY